MNASGATEALAHRRAGALPARRVREQVRDALIVVAFSACASSGISVLLVALTSWTG